MVLPPDNQADVHPDRPEFPGASGARHPGFPQVNSALAEDARYKFYGNANLHRDLGKKGHYFTAELEYSTSNANAKDADGNDVTSETEPWKLLPSEISLTYPESAVAFEAAYDDKGQLYDSNGKPYVPVANTAGDPFVLERTVRNAQVSFNYATRYWNVNNGFNYANTINKDEMTIVGLTIPAKSSLLLAPEATYITVYRDGTNRIKWQYWDIRNTFIVDLSHILLTRKVLNIGDRAKFAAINYSESGGLVTNTVTLPAETAPAQICRFRKFTKIYVPSPKYQFAQSGDVVYASWGQFIAFRQAAIAASAKLADPKTGDANYTGGIVDPQCEQLTQMPLDDNGNLDTAAITSGKYKSREFREYPCVSWNGLNLPRKGVR